MRTGFRFALLAEPYLFMVAPPTQKTHPLGAFALPRNFAFGEDSLVLPLTSKLDALCDGECEPDSASLAEPYLFCGGASNAKTHPLGAFALRCVDKKDAAKNTSFASAGHKSR